MYDNKGFTLQKGIHLNFSRDENIIFRKKLYLLNIRALQNFIPNLEKNNNSFFGDDDLPANYIYLLSKEEYTKYCNIDNVNISKPLRIIIKTDKVFQKNFSRILSSVKKYLLTLNNVVLPLINETNYKIDPYTYIESVLINDNISIIIDYDKIRAENINFFYSLSHGGITTKIKEVPKNVILIVKTPLNRLAFFNTKENERIKMLLQAIKIFLSKNPKAIHNIYNIIKTLMSTKCFMNSSVYFPSQKYFDMDLNIIESSNSNITMENRSRSFDLSGLFKIDEKGSLFVPSDIKQQETQFQKKKESTPTTISKTIENHLTNEKDATKYNIYIVNCCRFSNTKFSSITVERFYQYENFMSILNNIIFEILQNGVIPHQALLGIDCFEDYSTKFLTHQITNTNTFMNNFFSQKSLIKNTTLSPLRNSNSIIKRNELKQIQMARIRKSAQSAQSAGMKKTKKKTKKK